MANPTDNISNHTPSTANRTSGTANPAISPLTGSQFRITAGDYSATVTELGAGLREFRHRDRPVIAEYGADELPPGGAGQLLAPWPNRIDGGRYTVGDATCQLDLSEPAAGNAIHGLTRWAGWEPAGQDASSVQLRHVLHGRPGYPFRLELTAQYRLSESDGLTVSITASNDGSRAAPYGTGSHPYLTAGTRAVDDCELELPASQWLPASDRGIPSGPLADVAGTSFDFRQPRTIGSTRLDHALTSLDFGPDDRAWAWLASDTARIGLWAGRGYRWLQVFTADTLAADRRRRGVAVEPMTCPPNAFASGTDLLILQPGDSITHTWGITVLRP